MSASVAGVSAAGSAAAAPPQLSPGPHKLATLSASELRTGMQQHFRANGTLQQLKTQLRGMMLTDLLTQPTTARMLVGGAAQAIPPAPASSSSSAGTPCGGNTNGLGRLEDRAAALTPAGARNAVAAVPRRTDHTLQTWSCGLADALVENHLRRTRRAMSLSIFSTEAEVPPFSTSGAPSEEEQYLAHLFRQSSPQTAASSPLAGPAAGAAAADEDDFLTPSPSRSVKSVLQRLVEDCVTRQQGVQGGHDGSSPRHLHSCSTQTDAADTEGDGATNPLNSLECRLAAVDAKYALTFSQLRRTGAAGEQPFFLRSEVERRLAQYKSDMHAQLRSEYEQKYNTFTRVQLQEARDQAEERYRVQLRHKAEEFAEMERSVVVRLEQERERLKLSWEDVHQQRLEMERRQRDMAKQLADSEAAQQQQAEELHKATEACRALRLQCGKWEELCATRLMELDGARSREERRVEDLRRLQAEHAAELRLKDEEVSRLRYRIRLLSREVEVPTSLASAGGGGSGAEVSPPSRGQQQQQQQQPFQGGAPVDPKQLYGLLLRTEELQRNAVVQQQQQQQRWDAAWVAASSAAATGGAADPGQLCGSSVQATPAPAGNTTRPDAAPATQAALSRTPASTAPPAASASEPASIGEVSSKPAAAGPPPVTRIPASPGAALEAVEEAAPAPPPPPSPPAATPIVAAATTKAASPAVVSRQGSTSTARTAATTTTTSRSTNATSKSKRSAKANSVPSSADSTPVTKSSKTKSTSTSTSATPEKTPDKEKERNEGASAQSLAAPANTAALQKTETDEGVSRNAIVEEEVTARAGIVWSERNKRDIVAETLRQAAQNRSGSDDGSDGSRGGAAVRPWERLGMGGGAAASAPALGGGTIFDNSFSTDDDALIRSTTEDDSDF